MNKLAFLRKELQSNTPTERSFDSHRVNHMLAKNHDKDRWFSHLRMPYERVFSKRNPRVRYRGLAKNQFAAFMSAISFNLNHILVLNPPGFVFS